MYDSPDVREPSVKLTNSKGGSIMVDVEDVLALVEQGLVEIVSVDEYGRPKQIRLTNAGIALGRKLTND